MVRISDILKQGGHFSQPDKPEKEKKEEEAPVEEAISSSGQDSQESPASGIQFSKAMSTEGRSPAEKEIQVAGAMHKMQIDPAESLNIYNQALKVITQILNRAQSDEPLDLKEAYGIVKVITDRLILGDKELISLTANHESNSAQDNYLYSHCVNICVLSIYLGFGLGYNKSKLHELGLGALLHDLGMIKVMEVAGQPRVLNEREFEEIKKHPLYSSDFLKKVKEVQEGVIYIAEQAHERFGGQGYPRGLKDDEIHAYAKIAAVVDVYEALTHGRPYRKALQPHEAIKELLAMNSSGLFDMSLLKALINRMGIYPVGCWVELNSSEIGKVVSTNDDSPLRPKVNIIFGPTKDRLPQIKSIDLSAKPNLFIKRSINPQELDLKLDS